MLVSIYLRTVLILIGLSLAPLMTGSGQSFSVDPGAELLPEKLADYRAAGPIESITKELLVDEFDVKPFGITSWAARKYVSRDGGRFSVILITTSSDSGAYSKLTNARSAVQMSSGGAETSTTNVGTADFSYWDSQHNRLSFFKGKVFASVQDDGKSRDMTAITNFATALAGILDKGDGEIPVLVKHLPDWQNVQSRVLYAVSPDTLKTASSNQPVFDVVSFEGGAEAVVANYDTQRLVIIEFNTASLATDNNQRITARIQELRNQGQPVPTAYRRVGNYAVFVFDAPSEQAANQLIDQVKYQQVVQWLGENPFAYEQATREFTETTLGVFVAVVKASGLALVACFAVGGFLGALLFSFRRAQQRAKEAYSDSDAMLRLNLDELTPESDPARLLRRGN
jgi:hypothetical protein